jgi:hypothetical protein
MADIILEEVSRKILLIMRDKLPDQLSAVAAEMSAQDAEFYLALGQEVPEVPLSPPVRYEVGHNPTVTKLPLDDYPALVVLCYGHDSAQDEGSDQYEVLAHAATVEMVAMHDDVVVMNSIAMRNAKALHRTILLDRTLGGLTEPIALSPSVLVSAVTTRHKDDRSNEQTYIQACLLEYTFNIEQPW